MNNNLNTVVIAPMTTSLRSYPTRVQVNQNKKKGWIVLDQLRTIDKIRIVKKLGLLSFAEIKNLKEVLKETYFD